MPPTWTIRANDRSYGPYMLEQLRKSVAFHHERGNIALRLGKPQRFHERFDLPGNRR